MPTYTFYIYSVSVLSYNGGTNSFDLDASYDHTQDRYRIEVSDDDTVMNVSDGNQVAQVYDMDGNLVDSGLISVPAYGAIDDGAGGTIFLDRVEIDGVHYGYVSSTPLTPGLSYPFQFSNTFEEDHSYYQANSVPCFGPGTSIATARGARPMDDLQVGDLVQTLDHGLQPIRWIGRARVSEVERALNPSLDPVLFVGSGPHISGPPSALWLSGTHLILARSTRAELYFGTPEVLCPAGHVMVSGERWPENLPIDYTHILFDRHEVINANGLWVESLYPGRIALAALPRVLRNQVLRHIAAEGDFPTARHVLTGRETALLFGAGMAGDLTRAA